MAIWKSELRVPEHTLAEQVGDEMVLLNLDSGKYYGLDEVGARMWSLLAGLGAMEPVYLALIEEYEVAPGQLRHDLATLVNDLVDHGLLDIVDA